MQTHWAPILSQRFMAIEEASEQRLLGAHIPAIDYEVTQEAPKQWSLRQI